MSGKLRLDDLFDPARLRERWEGGGREAGAEEQGAPAAEADGGERRAKREPPPPALVALERLEGAVRSRFGERAAAIEPVLAEARGLIEAKAAADDVLKALDGIEALVQALDAESMAK